jgi:hypothetical protein
VSSRAADRTRREFEPALTRQALELALFAATGALTLGAWLLLMGSPPTGRAAAALAVSSLFAAALLAVRERVASPAARFVACVVLLAAACAGSLLACGVDATLLKPSNWGALDDLVSAGLRDAGLVDLPYDQADPWIRTVFLMLPAGLLLLAALLCFLPARRGRGLSRILSLLVLVASFAIAISWRAPSGELIWGLPLTVLICAWLWLPGVGGRRLGLGLAAAIGAGALALPLAAFANHDDALVNYRDWAPFGQDDAVSFQWNHTYGPLQWPQIGTTMLTVKSAEPLYWKAEVLDQFDGVRWSRSEQGGEDGVEDPREATLAGIPPLALQKHPQWIEQMKVEVGKLRSGLLISSGNVTQIDGVDAGPAAGDGTTTMNLAALGEGDRYALRVYEPQPSARQLRDAPQRYPAGLRRYTTLSIPTKVLLDQNPASSPVDSLSSLTAPLRSRAAGSEVKAYRRGLAGSPYLRVYELAQRLTRDSRSDYDVVQAIQDHLRGGAYRYDQDVGQRHYPLPAFLFRDKAGYCQQFSGAMALMLRMEGIPSRVVSGFSPGFLEKDGTYRVRDTDAHSWVEVWFSGIGWVPFDPTPSAAPAASRPVTDGAATPLTIDPNGRGRAAALEANITGGELGAVDTGPGEPSRAPFYIFLALCLPAAAAAFEWRRRRQRLRTPDGAPAQLAELVRAHRMLNGDRPGGSGMTLLELERELSPAGPAATGYVAKLRHNRFARGRPRRPGPGERRALRRALAKGSGPLRRLRLMRAFPPGGPGRA